VDELGTSSPGFAPAAGERGMVVWRGVAVCGAVLMALSVLLPSVALVVVLEAGAAAERDPVAGGMEAAGLDRRGEAAVLRTTGPEAPHFRGAVAVAPRPEARPCADEPPKSATDDTVGDERVGGDRGRRTGRGRPPTHRRPRRP